MVRSWGAFGRTDTTDAGAGAGAGAGWHSYLTLAQTISDPTRRLEVWKQRYALLAAMGAPGAVLNRVQLEINAAQKAVNERQSTVNAADQWNVSGQAVLLAGLAVAAAGVFYLVRRA